MIIKIKNRKAANLPYLARLVLRYIYDKEHLSNSEIDLMQESVVAWNKKIFIHREEKHLIQRLGWLLKQNEEGKLERRKALFKKHNIIWQKFHRLPEAGPYAN